MSGPSNDDGRGGRDSDTDAAISGTLANLVASGGDRSTLRFRHLSGTLRVDT